MPLEIVTVPCRTDNYAFLLHDSASGQTALVDAPEAPAIMAALAARGWTLTDILITHHHGDHVEGVAELRAAFGVRVIGAAADAHRLPALDLAVRGGDSFAVCGQGMQVIEVPGHTVGHIAYHLPDSAAVFTADSLMALGCGRLFEGTAAQMWDSLLTLRALPHGSLIYSGHEYTAANGRFAATIEPDNPALISRLDRIAVARKAGLPTVPSTLAEEIDTNPFLRADHPALRAATQMTDHPAVEVFAALRRAKDKF